MSSLFPLELNLLFKMEAIDLCKKKEENVSKSQFKGNYQVFELN